jgi:GT2 family glycosyltransferase
MYIPANPMLNKSFVYNYYRVYCGNPDKLEIICDIIGKDVKEINFNKDFGVFEFICENKEEKEKIDGMFGESIILDRVSLCLEDENAM